MTTDDYLDQVLAHLPRTTPRRQQIALELRGHIQERLDSGQPLDDVLRQLGDPSVLAESYLAGLSLTPADFGPRVLAKVVDVLGFLLLVGVILGLAWVIPGEGMKVLLIGVAIAIAALRLPHLHHRRRVALGADVRQAPIRPVRRPGEWRADHAGAIGGAAAVARLPDLLDRRVVRALHRATSARVRTALQDPSGARRRQAGLGVTVGRCGRRRWSGRPAPNVG